MGWTYPAYEGLKATGDPSAYRVALWEMIYALKQRNTAIGGLGTTTFKRADGSNVSSDSITFADLEDIKQPGAISNFKTNLQRLHNWIRSSADRFTVASGRSASLTISDLETNAGLWPFAPQAGDKWQDYTFWQGCQDALDMMIYGYQINPSPTGTQDFKYATYPGTDPDLTWQACSAVGETSTGGTDFFVPPFDFISNKYNLRWTFKVGLPSNARQKRAITSTTTPTSYGALSEAWLDFGPDDPGGFYYYAYTGDPLEIQFDSATETTLFNAAGTTDEDFTYQLLNADFPLGTANEFALEITNAVPSLAPFTGSMSPMYGESWAMFAAAITYYIDLASALDDQS